MPPNFGTGSRANSWGIPIVVRTVDCLSAAVNSALGLRARFFECSSTEVGQLSATQLSKFVRFIQ